MIKRTISYKLAFTLVIILTLGLVISGCKKDEFKPEESFIKVYNDQDGSRNYFPLSMQRASDEGYLVLSAYNGWNIHLLKTDKVGDLLWEYDLPSKYINAVPNLVERNGNLYFVCMDAVGLFSYVMQVDENGQNAIEFQQFQQIKYPLYVADNENAVFIQTYERSSYRTGIFQLSGAMDQVVNAGSVPIYTDVEDKIVDHLNFTGKRFPFFLSVTPENNYIVMSGFNNYSFSTVFMDANLNFSGVYNGAAFDGGVNAILPLGGNQFSLARFSFSNLYFNPSATLSPNTIDIVESIPAEGKAELDAQSPVLIKNVSIQSSDYVVYLATTKSNQLLLSFYQKGSSELIGTKYLGQSVPLKACDFEMTADGGLMILTRVTVMGSYNRVATIKLSKAELEAVVE
jgi:hypothetical protein|tara:strand:- start:8885 stop:10084 length:1200 start_codon:yes stop_codon:yes gene_type:complete